MTAEATTLIDFLYSDHERVASLLAQIQGEGALKESSRSGVAASKGIRSGKLNLGLVDGASGSERNWAKEVRLTYDPLWRNSRGLIEHVTEQVPSNQFGLGQLRVISGTLIAYDFSSLTSIMNVPEMESYIAGGIGEILKAPTKANHTATSEKKREARVIREFLRSFPLGIGFVLVTENAHFWFSVKREYLSLHSLDIPLKFPVHVSGVWKALGIIDALPNDHIEGLQPIIDRQIDGLMPSMVVNMMQLMGATAALFGRPLQAYGLSPLIVYRELTS